MPRANLKRKANSVICAVIEPKPDLNRQWREVKGVIMEAGSQEHINSWWQVFTEMGRETVEVQRRERRNRQRGNRR